MFIAYLWLDVFIWACNLYHTGLSQTVHVWVDLNTNPQEIEHCSFASIRKHSQDYLRAHFLSYFWLSSFVNQSLSSAPPLHFSTSCDCSFFVTEDHCFSSLVVTCCLLVFEETIWIIRLKYFISINYELLYDIFLYFPSAYLRSWNFLKWSATFARIRGAAYHWISNGL